MEADIKFANDMTNALLESNKMAAHEEQQEEFKF